MSWDSYKTALIATIEGEGYKRIPQNKIPENAATSHNHKAYELKWKGMDDVALHTGNSLSFENLVSLRVIYLNMDSAAMDANADLIITLMTAIKNDTNFVSFVTNPKTDDFGDKNIIMSTTFLYGVVGC